MSKRNRRQFLEESMLATAAAVAANSGGKVFGQDQPQSKSPNERLNVCVVGVNGRGSSHLGAFANGPGRKDTVITHICDVDQGVGGKKAEEVGKRQGGITPKFEEDIRKVLEDKSVDIVTIATPNHWHSLAAAWAIMAGKDVYVEKPVSHNVSEGRRVVENARVHKRICQTGTQCRSNPGLIQAIDYVKSGKIGELKVARGLCYKRRPSIGPRGVYEVPKGVNYDLWCGPAPMGPLTRPKFHYDWHWQWDFGNGDLGNQGIHQMDIARWGLGIDELCKSVFSYGGRLGYEDAGETANTQVVVCDYDKQSLVFEVRGLETKHYKGAGVGVIFEGTDGYLVIPSYDTGVAFDKDGNKVQEFTGSADHFANFLAAVRSRKHTDLTADILEGHLSSALCHLGNISYRLGTKMGTEAAWKTIEKAKTTDNAKDTFERTMAHLKDNKLDLASVELSVGPVLPLNPKTERFTENEAANKMLTRDYRKGFEVPGAGTA
ncbi:MAG TPA: Gfo/Idh/MocA family oxidoreductase [Pirellulaceae bacterium]|nr:Gfo/Idh/MocA family oxidoreductase [Pirellulaceae bacterium]